MPSALWRSRRPVAIICSCHECKTNTYYLAQLNAVVTVFSVVDRGVWGTLEKRPRGKRGYKSPSKFQSLIGRMDIYLHHYIAVFPSLSNVYFVFSSHALHFDNVDVTHMLKDNHTNAIQDLHTTHSDCYDGTCFRDQSYPLGHWYCDRRRRCIVRTSGSSTTGNSRSRGQLPKHATRRARIDIEPKTTRERQVRGLSLGWHCSR